MTHRLLPIAILLAVFPLAQASAATEYLTSPATTARNLPFSEAVRVANMLYLSGQIGADPATGSLVAGGIKAETRQVMENIKAVLERNDSALEKVVKCTVMIENIAEWGDFNEVYVTYFPGPKPARSAFGAAGLALGAKVEVECWAAQ